MVRTLALSEIFDLASRIRSTPERIQIIRSYRSPLMEYVVKGAYHPDVKWLIPPGQIAYRPAHRAGDNETLFYSEARKLHFFVEGVNPGPAGLWNEKMSFDKIMSLFVLMLETIHPDDAKILMTIKDKYIDYPFLTYEFFQKAFPDWLPPREGDVEPELKPEPVPVVYENGEKPGPNKGKMPWNVGIKMTAEHRQKLSEAAHRRRKRERAEREATAKKESENVPTVYLEK